MGKKNRSKKTTPRPPRRTSSRKRIRTEKGLQYDEQFEEYMSMSPSRKRNRTEESLHEEQFEEFKSMSANETSVADKSGNLTDSHVQTNTEDSPPSSSTADQTEVAVEEESNASDDIESLLTQRTPEVPPDQVCMTPRDDTQTNSSTPGIKCIGKESRGNSVNLMVELEEAALTEESCEKNQIADDCNSNVSELHLL